MPLFEVQVRQVSTVIYVLEAKDSEQASQIWGKSDYEGEFIDQEDVVSVQPYDTRFDEDDTELIDDYEIEQEDTDE